MSIGTIDTSRIEAMVAQLQARATRAAGVEMPGVKPLQAGATAPVDFQSVLKSSLDQVNQVQTQAQTLSERFAIGDTNVSLSDTMIAVQKAGVALQQTVQVRNKLVQAYQEIMNMGI
jgi:flagellar hook-basal body complex protein FliE